MMRIVLLSFIVFFNFILQSTWLNGIAVFGVVPNTILIIIVCYALLRDDVEGAILGFCAGLLQDLLFGQVIGISAFLMMMTGFLCGKPFKDFYKENYIVPLIMVALASVAYETAFYIINFLLLGRINFIRYLGQIILPVTAYNLIFSIFIYRLIYMFDTVLRKRDDKKRGFMNKKIK